MPLHERFAGTAIKYNPDNGAPITAKVLEKTATDVTVEFEKCSPTDIGIRINFENLRVNFPICQHLDNIEQRLKQHCREVKETKDEKGVVIKSEVVENPAKVTATMKKIYQALAATFTELAQ